MVLRNPGADDNRIGLFCNLLPPTSISLIRCILQNITIETHPKSNRGYIFPAQATHTLPQAKLADRAKLIRHCLPLFPVQGHVGFRRIEPVYIAGQRRHLDPVQRLVRHVVANDHGRPSFSRFRCLRMDRGPPIRPRRAMALYLGSCAISFFFF